MNVKQDNGNLIRSLHASGIGVGLFYTDINKSSQEICSFIRFSD